MTRKPLIKLSGIHNVVTTALIIAKRLNTKVLACKANASENFT